MTTISRSTDDCIVLLGHAREAIHGSQPNEDVEYEAGIRDTLNWLLHDTVAPITTEHTFNRRTYD